jgi:hypothetical protein
MINKRCRHPEKIGLGHLSSCGTLNADYFEAGANATSGDVTLS